MKRFLKVPVNPIDITVDATVDHLVKQFSDISFQARNVGTAVEIWERMLDDDALIFLGLAGAMVPAGMRKVVSFLVKNRFVDCIVSTGANLFHDCHESLGYAHWRGTHHVDDVALKENKIDRIYDTFASEAEFQKTDDFITGFAEEIPQNDPLTTREFLAMLGKKLNERNGADGILVSAYRSGIPIYCPGLADSSIGIAIAAGRNQGRNSVVFDIISDVLETAKLAVFSATGVVYVGGGVPKNFIQQTEVTASVMGVPVPGHKYAIQVITDPPHWGGLSGCTFEEAQSWGKIAPEAFKVTVYSDATIALPLIVTALATRRRDNIKKRRLPKFDMSGTLSVSF